jgi:hypothetical protein
MKTQTRAKHFNEFVGKQSEMLHSCAMCGGHRNCEIIKQMQTARNKNWDDRNRTERSAGDETLFVR